VDAGSRIQDAGCRIYAKPKPTFGPHAYAFNSNSPAAKRNAQRQT